MANIYRKALYFLLFMPGGWLPGYGQQLLSSEELTRLGYRPVDMFEIFEVERDTLYKMPDVLPMYPGGIQGLLKDYYSSVTYPMKARRKGWQGKLFLRYVIERDGSIAQIEVLCGPQIQSILKDAAIEGLAGLKRWHPGFDDGQPVRVQFTQPVSFKLR